MPVKGLYAYYTSEGHVLLQDLHERKVEGLSEATFSFHAFAATTVMHSPAQRVRVACMEQRAEEQLVTACFHCAKALQ